MNNATSTSLQQLFIYLPILGFILRSTNVRNAFEAYAPLLRLARTLLGSDKKLILSSEWEYSPFTYVSITRLPGFVLIGLPATESANPLLIPLAGHELGHSVWAQESCITAYEGRIEAGILEELTTTGWPEYSAIYTNVRPEDLTSGTMFVRPTWVPAFTWCCLQTEEMFCDFLGLRLFAEAYLHAFTYLMAPRTAGQRSLAYPNLIRRAEHLVEAAKHFGVACDPSFGAAFEDRDEPSEPTTRLLVKTADIVSESLSSDLIALAQRVADERGAAERTTKEVARIASELQTRVAPPSHLTTLADIVNAGWVCNLKPDLWEGLPQFEPKERDRILRDLVLKSMEVLEIRERVGEQA